ncbi:hypothetical protein [Nocardia sp. NPDC004260]
MIVASFVLSIIGICVAGTSASFTWRNMRVSERNEAINRDRRRDELKPEWDEGRSAILTRDGYARVYELVLVLKKGDVHSVTVEIDQSWPSFAVSTPGVHPSNLQRAEFGPLTDGDEAAWRVELGPIGEHPASSIRLRLTSVAGEHAWTQTMKLAEPVRTVPIAYPDE